MSEDNALILVINPGIGGYWEAKITVGDEEQVFRSYKLERLINVLCEQLREYESQNG